MKDAHYIAGLIALAAMDVLFFFSISGIREKAFNLFKITHGVATGTLMATASPKYPKFLTISVTTLILHLLFFFGKNSCLCMLLG